MIGCQGCFIQMIIEIRLSHQIKDTDRPLALKASAIDFIRQFQFFINKNGHLKEMKAKDVLELID